MIKHIPAATEGAALDDKKMEVMPDASGEFDSRATGGSAQSTPT
jgi:hypothetical protein